jgi:hypothetical protein
MTPEEPKVDEIGPLLDKALTILTTLQSGKDGCFFPSGIESVQIKVSAGNKNFELNLAGKAAAEHLSQLRISELAGDAVRALIGPGLAFVLPPQVSGKGYYSYSPAQNQYGTSNTIGAVLDVGRQWQFNSEPPFGIGDISLVQGGPMPGHTTGHQIGRNVDVRPMRTDGTAAPVTWQDAQYSQALTQLLVDNFRAHVNCSRI